MKGITSLEIHIFVMIPTANVRLRRNLSNTCLIMKILQLLFDIWYVLCTIFPIFHYFRVIMSNAILFRLLFNLFNVSSFPHLMITKMFLNNQKTTITMRSCVWTFQNNICCFRIYTVMVYYKCIIVMCVCEGGGHNALLNHYS